MDDLTVGVPYTNHEELDKVNLHEEVPKNGMEMQPADDAMKFLAAVDFDLAYSSKKLVNLHLLLMHLLVWNNDLEAMAMGDSLSLEISVEKALVFDLLSGILDSELQEFSRFLDALRAHIFYASHKISSCRHSKELFVIMEEKLHDSKESLRHSQEQFLEIRMQLAELQRSFSYFKEEKRKKDEVVELSGNDQLFDSCATSKKQTTLQHRHVIRTLEKSFSRELYLEEKLSLLRQNEEQLKLKLHYTEQVAFRMEEAAEVVWGRFLEAENAAEVLMGISKELLGQLHIAQLNLYGSMQREVQLKSKLEDCIEELSAKDVMLQKLGRRNEELESSNAQHATIISEVLILKEKIKSLEEQLKDTEFQLESANSFYKTSQEQLDEAENIIEVLKESIYEAEGKAGSTEAKVTELTEANLELTEELNFLKGNDSDTKKISLLEKQLREQEIQLQNAKASSQTNQEQQNMLYSAIWDMETLIEDLKSKVSRAETKTERAEEQCILLSKTNFELNKELKCLKSRMEELETSLDQVNNVKHRNAKEINSRTEVMMDMVMQLAVEREHMQKQLNLLSKENKILLEKLQKLETKAYMTTPCSGDIHDQRLKYSQNEWRQTTCTKESEKAESLTTCLQNRFVKDKADCVEPMTQTASSKLQHESSGKAGKLSHACVFMVVFVVLLSVSVICLSNKKSVLFDNF